MLILYIKGSSIQEVNINCFKVCQTVEMNSLMSGLFLSINKKKMCIKFEDLNQVNGWILNAKCLFFF